MPERLAVRIAGSGRCVPERILDNQYFESILETSDAWIRERTGIQRRHVVSDGESSGTLAAAAARAALADAQLEPNAIDLIIVATVTPEHIFPSTSVCVGRDLGLTSTPAFDLSATCTGFIYAMVTAAGLIRAGLYRCVLVIGAETMSRITDYQDRSCCILFGDGAGAVVLEASPAGDEAGILNHHLYADGRGGNLLLVPAGGSRLPTSQLTLNERLHYVKMQGREVFKAAVTALRESVSLTLEEARVTPDELSLLIPHQSNLRIIEAARQRLGLPPEKVYVNIDRMGNTSAASIPIALDEVLRSGRLKRGDLALFAAFGAGFTWGTLLLRL